MGTEANKLPSNNIALAFQRALLIVRRRWIVALILLGLSVATAAIFTATAVRIYRSQALLEIRPEMPMVLGDPANPVLAVTHSMWDTYFHTQQQIMQNAALGTEVVKALPESLRKEYEGLQEPGAALASKVDVENIQSSFILKVGVADTDPQKAAQIVNTLVTVYMEEVNRRVRQLKTVSAEAIESETLPGIRTELARAEKARHDFRVRTGFVNFAEQNAMLTQTRQKLAGRLAEIRLRRIELRAQVDALSNYGTNGIDGIFYPMFRNTQLLGPLVDQWMSLNEQLLAATRAYQPGHERLVELRKDLTAIEERIRECIRSVLQTVQTDVNIVEREEEALLAEDAKLERQIAETSAQYAEEGTLNLELTSARDLYNVYVQRRGESNATSGSGLCSVRVIDFAKPSSVPWKPNMKSNLFLGGVVGVLLVIVYIVIAEQLDDRICGARELEIGVGIPVIGIIPRFEKANGLPVLLTEDSKVEELESFRALRVQILTRLEKTGRNAKVLTVTSAVDSEGKSTIALNLARSIASQGQRVLLLDADMRRPAIRKHFSSHNGPGLESYLRREARFEEVVRSSEIPGVDIVGAVEGIDKVADLPIWAAYDEMLRSVRERYEFIVVDSSPITLVAEASMVARRADAAVLVTRDAYTRRSSASAALRQLRELGVEVVGGVLNFSSPRGDGYYYARHKREKREEEELKVAS